MRARLTCSHAPSLVRLNVQTSQSPTTLARSPGVHSPTSARVCASAVPVTASTPARDRCGGVARRRRAPATCAGWRTSAATGGCTRVQQRPAKQHTPFMGPLFVPASISAIAARHVSVASTSSWAARRVTCPSRKTWTRTAAFASRFGVRRILRARPHELRVLPLPDDRFRHCHPKASDVQCDVSMVVVTS